MHLHHFHRIVPAAALAAGLAFTAPAIAQGQGQVGNPVPANAPTSPVILDSAAMPDTGAAARATESGAKQNKKKADDKKATRNPSKSDADKATKAGAHSGHGPGAHRADSLPKDTTIILGTPGSPTTQGVPGTGIDGGK